MIRAATVAASKMAPPTVSLRRIPEMRTTSLWLPRRKMVAVDGVDLGVGWRNGSVIINPLVFPARS